MELIFNKSTKMWEERKKPYAVVECETKDDYEMLENLIKAKLDGRCVVLPCKVGDKIYKLFCGNIVELEVELIVCWSSGYWKVNAHTEYSRTDWTGFEIDFSDFGKTVFLTHEAAAAALKGGRDA